MAALISSKEAFELGASTASYRDKSIAASLIGLSGFGDASMPARRETRRGEVKSEDGGSNGWMVEGWPISDASSAVIKASAAAREDGDGSASMSSDEG